MASEGEGHQDGQFVGKISTSVEFQQGSRVSLHLQGLESCSFVKTFFLKAEEEQANNMLTC